MEKEASAAVWGSIARTNRTACRAARSCNPAYGGEAKEVLLHVTPALALDDKWRGTGAGWTECQQVELGLSITGVHLDVGMECHLGRGEDTAGPRRALLPSSQPPTTGTG